MPPPHAAQFSGMRAISGRAKEGEKMACSCCAAVGHNVQTCPSVRRCGHCNGRGHDRRNCSKLVPRLPAAESRASSLAEVCAKYRNAPNLLAHLYWPERTTYFTSNVESLKAGGDWLFTATPGHGVQKPTRPTLNFFEVNEGFMTALPAATLSRSLRHGVLLRRSALVAGSGFELAEVRVGHPGVDGVKDPAANWQFDIGNHRFGALGELSHAKVVRFATPYNVRSRRVVVRASDVVAYW